MADTVYSESEKILSADADMFRRFRLSSLFRKLQEISIAHTEALGAGRDKTLDKGVLWVIARVKLEISRIPLYGERVTLSTVPGAAKHVLFPRYYTLYGDGEETLVKGSAVWLLMDSVSRKMAFPEKYGVAIPSGDVTGAICLPSGVEPEKCVKSIKYRVGFRDVDLNGHLNNTRFLDLADDILGAEYLEKRVPSSIEIGYETEAEYGSEITVGYNVEDAAAYFEGRLADGRLCFRLKTVYSSLKNNG